MPGIDPNKMDEDFDVPDLDAELNNIADDTGENLSADDAELVEKPKLTNSISGKIILVVAIAVVAVIAAMIIIPKLTKGKSEEQPVATVTDSPTPAVNQAGEENTLGNDSTEAGTEVTGYPMNDDITEEQVLLKDLSGKKVPEKYTVVETKFVREMVNYEKHRTVTDDGMEFLWLSVDYKEKEYICEVPFYVYKDLDPKGITIVTMEVLVLKDGGEMVSYMEVVSNFREIIGN